VADREPIQENTALEDALDQVKREPRPLSNVVVVMPAFRAAHTLERTFREIPRDRVDHVILVDDASNDDTAKVARSLGIETVVHEQNRGYGANQKTCYDAARARKPDAVVMLHPDYQYDPRLIPYFLGYLEMNVCDVMLGSRIRTRQETLEGGMPVYKYLSNRFLTMCENLALGQNIGDFHSGFRVYTGNVLETVPYHKNSDDFVFDTEFLAQAVYFGFRIGDCPMPVRYFEEASSINFLRSLRYGGTTLTTMAKFLLQKWGFGRFSIFAKD
jgi:glycosyltransferase involved in cell wall biosynthesis